jgi:hypothetical protein
VSEEIETKIVITHKDNRANIGIQQTNCDPVFFMAEGDIPSSLGCIPGFLEEARRKWQTSPRNPEADLPAPAPPPTPTASRPAAKATAKPDNQQQEAMF